MLKVLGGIAMSFFYIFNPCQSSKKCLFPVTGFCGREDEDTNPIDCLNISYYPNACAALCCAGV